MLMLHWRPLMGRLPLSAIVIVPLIFPGCSHAPAAKRYELQGRVVAVDAADRQLTIAHQDIAGHMKAMTMPFIVSKRDMWVFRAIAPVVKYLNDAMGLSTIAR